MNGYMEIIFDGIFEFLDLKLIQVHEYGHLHFRLDVIRHKIKKSIID